MKYLSIVAIFAVFMSCSAPGKKEQAEEKQPSLKDQVMSVHDEVMPKMGTLRKTQKNLLALADSVAADSLAAAGYAQLAANLQLANESMMVWMRNFEPNYEGTPEEVENYLKEQLKAIEKVKSDMLESLEEGTKALSSK